MNIKKIVAFLSLFLLLFDLALPPVKSIGSTPYSLIISIVFILLNSHYKNIKISNFYPLISIYFLLTVFVLLRTLFSDYEDTSFLLTMAKANVVLISSIFYILAFGKIVDFRMLIAAFSINTILSIVFGSNPELLKISMLFKNGVHDQIVFLPYRDAFFAGSSAFGLSAPYTLMICITSWFIIKKERNLYTFLGLLLIIVGGLLSGRLAFIGVMLSFMLFLFYYQKGVLFYIICSFPVVSFILLNDTLSHWLFEFYYSWINGDGINSESTDILKSMFFIPDISTWVYGDGIYKVGNGYYGNTDVGYLRHLLYGGIIFSILVLSIPFFIYRQFKSDFILFIMLPLTYIIHLKGVVILSNPTYMATFIISSFYLVRK